jgi:single-strand DNA-binding protein
MSSGVNKVMILGNVGSDPAISKAKDGSSVANISVATSISWKDRATGEKREQTEWHKIVFFKNLADIVAQYVVKGSKVFVEGSIRTNKWKNDAGVEQSAIQIVGSNIQIVSAKNTTVSAVKENSQPSVTVEPVFDDLDDIPF